MYIVKVKRAFFFCFSHVGFLEEGESSLVSFLPSLLWLILSSLSSYRPQFCFFFLLVLITLFHISTLLSPPPFFEFGLNIGKVERILYY